MKTKARFVGAAEMEGSSIAVFSPPHNEADFLWLSLEDLMRALLPLVKPGRAKPELRTPLLAREKAAHSGKIVWIVPHPVAQRLCAALDSWNGHKEAMGSNVLTGPAVKAYIEAMLIAHKRYMPFGMKGLQAAFENQGGPQVRGRRP